LALLAAAERLLREPVGVRVVRARAAWSVRRTNGGRCPGTPLVFRTSWFLWPA